MTDKAGTFTQKQIKPSTFYQLVASRGGLTWSLHPFFICNTRSIFAISLEGCKTSKSRKAVKHHSSSGRMIKDIKLMETAIIAVEVDLYALSTNTS